MMPQQWRTSYQKDYNNKKPVIKCDNQQVKQMLESYQKQPALPGEYQTIHRTDFYPKQSTEKRYKPANNVISVSDPLSSITSYKEQFLNYKGINFGKQDKVHNNYVVPLQFHFNTTYNNDFINHNQAEKMQPCLPTNLNPFPRIDLFLGESTNQRDFSPKERDPTKKQIATDNYVIGIPSIKE